MLIGITTVKTVCDCRTQEWILRLYVGQHQGAQQNSCFSLIASIFAIYLTILIVFHWQTQQ